MVTPLSSDGRRLDIGAVPSYVRWLGERGVDGIFVAGTTGEGPLLTPQERDRLVESAVVSARPLGLTVVAHVGAATTDEAIRLARAAGDAGADAMAAVMPWFYAYDEESLITHLACVAEAAPEVPLFAYHIPSAARNPVSPAVIFGLARHAPNFVGIKDSGGDLVALRELARAGHAARHDGFTVFCGADGIALAALLGGADGIVSGNASAVPEPFVALWQAVRTGDLREARRQQDRVDQVRTLLRNGGDLGLFKAVLAERGMPVGAPRPPLPVRSAEAARRALRALEPL